MTLDAPVGQISVGNKRPCHSASCAVNHFFFNNNGPPNLCCLFIGVVGVVCVCVCCSP